MPFTRQDAERVAHELGVDFGRESFDLEQLRMGMEVELEHGSRAPDTDVTHDDPVLTGKIALAHLRELPDYYTRLAVVERAGEPGTDAPSPAAPPTEAGNRYGGPDRDIGESPHFRDPDGIQIELRRDGLMFFGGQRLDQV